MKTQFNITPSSKAPSFLKVKRVVVDTERASDRTPIRQELEILERKDSVGVLIFNQSDRKFTWVQQFRLGPAMKAQHSDAGWPIEPVAGMIEPGQTPLEAAIREVEEETHLTISKIEPISSFFMCPGVSDERMHLFCAVIDAQPLAGFGGLADEHENIIVHHWTAEETESAYQAGKMNTAHSMITWQWAKLNGLDKTPSLTQDSTLSPS